MNMQSSQTNTQKFIADIREQNQQEINELTPIANQNLQSIDIKHNGIIPIIIMATASAILFFAAIFVNTLEPDVRKGAAGVAAFFLFMSILVFSRRKHTVLTLTPQGIIVPISPTITIPWDAIAEYNLEQVSHGFVTINSSIDFYLNPNYAYNPEHNKKYRVIYKVKKNRIFISGSTFCPSMKKIESLIPQYMQIHEARSRLKELGVKN